MSNEYRLGQYHVLDRLRWWVNEQEYLTLPKTKVYEWAEEFKVEDYRMKHHTCKSWSPFFRAIKAGEKTHDLRYDTDRNFEVGDIITLKEYLPFEGKYTGESVDVVVTYITSSKTPCAFSSAVLDKEYCILSIKLRAVQVEGGVYDFWDTI